MSTEQEPETNPASEGGASEYIIKELEAAKKSLKNTKIIGSIIFLLLSGELIFITHHFIDQLQPTAAADIASGIITGQIDERGDAIASAIKEKVPELIASAPEEAKKQIPKYRQDLEDKVEADLHKYVKNTASDLDKRLDEYFKDHKTEIKTILDAGADPAAVHQVGGEIREQILGYLNDKPTEGDSIGKQIDQSLSDVKEVEAQIDHLAANQNLTPAEKQTRRALAIIAQTVNKSDLQPIPIPEALPAPTP